MDINELKQQTNILKVIESKGIHLKKEGTQFVALCPFHEEKSPSFKVSETKQIFKCFGCGKGGDAIDFLVHFGHTIQEAKSILEGDPVVAIDEFTKTKIERQQRIKWKHVNPAPAMPGQIVHYKHGKPSSFWVYRNYDGSIYGLICRFELEHGGKEVVPYIFCENQSGQHEWRWKGFNVPRPLYNLHLLDQDRSGKKTILLVEGEKTADAGTILLPHVITMTWPGGTNAVKHVDWAPLEGRNVLLWPDNDTEQKYGDTHPKSGQIKPFSEQPGNKVMFEIAEILAEKAKVVKWILNDPTFPHKWDLADAEWTSDEAREFARKNLIDVPDKSFEFPSEEEVEVVPEYIPLPIDPGPSAPPKQSSGIDHDGYFQILGFEVVNGIKKYIFFSREDNQVHRMTARQIGALNSLLELAPMDFWETWFASGRGNKVRIDTACNWMIRVANKVGFYVNRKERGLGVWSDNGRLIVNCGNSLIVDGMKMSIGDIKSEYIYKSMEPIKVSVDNPLSTIEANKLFAALNIINWDRKVNSHLIAGWTVISILSGALKWRPHIWLVGGAGVGKSWVLQEMVRPLLLDISLAVQSETTEPGLRQSMLSNAFPIVFDEFEAEDIKGRERVQSILNLMRASSSDDGGFIAKGSSAGSGAQYSAKSCFAFASIGMTATQQSDRSRISVLGMQLDPDPKRREETKSHLDKFVKGLDRKYCKGFQARALNLAPIILENARTFSNAAGEVLGNQRLGDQIGPLLAGSYSLFSEKLISPQDALKWVQDKDWSEERTLSENRDELRLFNFLMQQMIRVETSHASVTRSIVELCLYAVQSEQDSVIMSITAEETLKRYGIIVKDNKIFVSNQSSHIRSMLRNTPWPNNYSKILLRVDGAIAEDPMSFLGAKCRSVSVPIDLIKTINPTESKQTELDWNQNDPYQR